MDLRGRGGRDWTDVLAVPRLGGLHELLDPPRQGAIDAVIVEEIERISRLNYGRRSPGGIAKWERRKGGSQNR